MTAHDKPKPSDFGLQRRYDDYAELRMLTGTSVSHSFELRRKIKDATSHFKNTGEKEVRVLCKQDSREDRPNIFVENNLFILPIKNGIYAIIKGEGYVDIPEITSKESIYESKLNFKLDTSLIGNSEMQHLDFAYACSLIRTFACGYLNQSVWKG